MKFNVSILECDEEVLAAVVTAVPFEKRTWRLLHYAVVDSRADSALIRDLVVEAIVSGCAADMIEINGYHDCCVGGQTPWLRFKAQEVVQEELALGV